MLLSQKEERSRRFSLALRAGIPVLTLVFLVLSTTIYNKYHIYLSLTNSVLIAAIIFITIYFIYFLMNLSVQETLIDYTTHGFNKKTFIKKLQENNPKTIACIKIENLQELNENYSSEEIDTILYTITQRVNSAFKRNGFDNIILGRDRGSEFIIAIDIDAILVKTILEELVQDNHSINGIEIDYKFAIINNSNQNFEKIILQLRDIIQTQSTIRENSHKNSKIEDAKELSDIEKAVIESLKNKNLTLSFRPILNNYTNKIDSYEIATKLKDYNNNYILPRIFLPIINRLGLGREYDLILVKHIIDILPLVDSDISFTFNLSPFSLRDTLFQNEIFSYILDKKIDPNRLIVQLYERKTHHNLNRYLETLKYFRAKGIRICIDNFGSSNASMEYIKYFKFDMIQFDRDYVSKIDNNTTYAMLKSLVNMSKDLHIQTVAKWVDNDEQKAKLKELGIDYLQGFGIGKPLNETQLIDKYN